MLTSRSCDLTQKVDASELAAGRSGSNVTGSLFAPTTASLLEHNHPLYTTKMKLFYIGIFKNAEKPAHELVSAKDASTFSFWERST